MQVSDNIILKPSFVSQTSDVTSHEHDFIETELFSVYVR